MNALIVKKAKNLILPLIATLVIAPTLSSCTDQEVNTTVGVIAIGAGVALIAAGAAGGGGDRHDDHDFNRGPGHGGGFDHGRGGPGGGFGGGRGGFGGGHRMSIGLMDEVASVKESVAVQKSELDVSAFAKTFSLSNKSASIFINAMEKAKAGDAKALQNLGLAKSDLDGLKSFELPSESAIRAVAKNMQADVGATRDMLQALVNKAAESKNQINSDLANR